jgi:hypothetical protein
MAETALEAAVRDALTLAKKQCKAARTPGMRLMAVETISLLLEMMGTDDEEQVTTDRPPKKARTDGKKGETAKPSEATTVPPPKKQAPSPPPPVKKEGQKRDAREKGSWVTVAAKKATKAPQRDTKEKAKPAAPTLTGDHWKGTILQLEDFAEGKNPKEGVLLLPHGYDTRKATNMATHLRDLIKFKVGSAYTLVSPVAMTDSKRTPLKLSDGRVKDLFVLHIGAGIPSQDIGCMSAEVAPATQVLLASVLHREVSEGTKALLRGDGEGAAATLSAIVRRAAKGSGIDIKHEHVFKYEQPRGLASCLVRVKTQEVTKLLKDSGKEKVFFRTLSFSNGGHKEPLFWLTTETTLYEALRLHEKLSSGGVVAGTKRYGLRMTSPTDYEAYKVKAGQMACPPRVDKNMTLYEIRGASTSEFVEDVQLACAAIGWDCKSRKTFKSRGSLVVIVEAKADPPSWFMTRGHRPTLQVEKTENDSVLKNRSHSKRRQFVGPVRKRRVNLSEEDFPKLPTKVEVAPMESTQKGKRSFAAFAGDTAKAPSVLSTLMSSMSGAAAAVGRTLSKGREEAKEPTLPAVESESEEEMETDHTHDWQGPSRVMDDKQCALCETKIEAGRLALGCSTCKAAFLCSDCTARDQQ